MNLRSNRRSSPPSREVRPASPATGSKQVAQQKSRFGFPVELYSDKQIAEFDRIDEELKRHLQGKQ